MQNLTQHLEKRQNPCVFGTCGVKPENGIDVSNRPSEDITMTRIISALFFSVIATFSFAENAPLQLADGAPDHYVVKQGDTLWGLSSKYLKEPWRWKEIWRMNAAQVKNPHRIYPGDTLILERDLSGSPLLKVHPVRLTPKIYESTVDLSIPAIPPNVIEPFISSPLIVEANALDKAARIIATQQDRVFLGNGDIAYVDDADPSILKWQIYRNGNPLYDPEDPSRVLGFEAFYLGTALQSRPGSPATFEIIQAKQEIGRGDRLLPANRPLLQEFLPHKPDRLIDARLVSIYGGVGAAGRGSIISFNRGIKEGIEVGHVLALERNRSVSARDERDQPIKVSIPRERIGLVFVFRCFDHISYALVVRSEGTVEVNDFVSTP